MTKACKTLYVGIFGIVELFRGHSYKFFDLKIVFCQMRFPDYSLMRKEMLLSSLHSLVTGHNKATLVGRLESGTVIVRKKEKIILL